MKKKNIFISRNYGFSGNGIRGLWWRGDGDGGGITSRQTNNEGLDTSISVCTYMYIV